LKIYEFIILKLINFVKKGIKCLRREHSATNREDENVDLT